MAEIREIPIDQIKVGEHDQRLEKNDPGVAELAVSIKRVGLINPLIVVEVGDYFDILAGHRRLIAARVAGKERVPCIVRKSVEALDFEITFAENFFRKDLSPVELASAMADCYKSGCITIQGLAAGFHKTTHWVQRMIAICDWPADVLEAIHEKKISVSAASNLAYVTESKYRAFLVRNAVEQGATARTTAAWLQAWRSMESAEEAIRAEPVEGNRPQVPAMPQAPCFVCSNVFAVNEMSHVPMCGGCIKTIRQVGMS